MTRKLLANFSNIWQPDNHASPRSRLFSSPLSNRISCKRQNSASTPSMLQLPTSLRQLTLFEVTSSARSNTAMIRRFRSIPALHRMGTRTARRMSSGLNVLYVPPPVFKTVLPIALLHKWRLTKADVKSVLLKNWHAQPNVYIVPGRQRAKQWHYWLLLKAAYGPVTADVKWQEQSDKLFIVHSLEQLPLIPQLSFAMRDNSLAILYANIIDDLMNTGGTFHV